MSQVPDGCTGTARAACRPDPVRVRTDKYSAWNTGKCKKLFCPAFLTQDSTSRRADPLRDSHPELLTSGWEDIVGANHPGARTFGLNASQGCYASFGGCAPRHPGGMTVYRDHHWAFEGSDLYCERQPQPSDQARPGCRVADTVWQTATSSAALRPAARSAPSATSATGSRTPSGTAFPTRHTRTGARTA